MALFRRTQPDPRPAPPTDEQILTTLAAASLMMSEHDGEVRLSPEDHVILINAQAEAMRRGLF